ESPHSAIQRHPFGVGRPWFADRRIREDTMRSVEPSVRAPGKRVERLVRVLVPPPIEHDLRRTGGTVSARRNRNKKQIWRGADPHAAKPDFDAADEIQMLGEHFPAVETSIAIRVFENQDAIPSLAFRRTHRIGVRLYDPETS